MSLRPIHRIKHVVDAQIAVPLNTKITTILANAVDSPVRTNSSQVETGSTVNAIFLSVEIVASEQDLTATPNFYFLIFKNPAANLSMGNGNNIGVDINKKWVFHQEMVMVNNVNGGTPRNAFKGVISIPKRYRRFGPNDQIAIQYFIPSTGITVTACVQAHYKEFK